MSLGLDHLHPIQQYCVVRRPIGAEMNAPMAIRTKCDDKPRIIRAAVACSTYVMRLQVGRPVGTHEWSRMIAALADTLGPRQDIGSYICRALINRTFGCSRCRRRRSGCECSIPELCQVVVGYWLGFNVLNNCIEATQLENNRSAAATVCIFAFTITPALAGHFSHESQIAFGIVLLEHEDRTAILCVVADCLVPAGEFHVTTLPFAKVEHGSIRPDFIIVSEFSSASAGHYEDRTSSFCDDDACLAIPTESGMNFISPVVAPANFESVRHKVTPWLHRSASACSVQGCAA